MDAGLTCLAMVVRSCGVPAEPSQLCDDLGRTADTCADDLLRAARRWKLNARGSPLDIARIARGRTPLPAIVALQPMPLELGGEGYCRNG